MDIIGAGPSHIIVGGISQGCATTIYALFQGKERLGGFLGLCSWLHFEMKVVEITSASPNPASAIQNIRKLLHLSPASTTPDIVNGYNSLHTPVFLSHSIGDPVIDVGNGQKLSSALGGLGMAVDWQTYNEEHWITEPEGIDHIGAFLEKIIGI